MYIKEDVDNYLWNLYREEEKKNKKCAMQLGIPGGNVLCGSPLIILLDTLRRHPVNNRIATGI